MLEIFGFPIIRLVSQAKIFVSVCSQTLIALTSATWALIAPMPQQDFQTSEVVIWRGVVLVARLAPTTGRGALYHICRYDLLSWGGRCGGFRW